VQPVVCRHCGERIGVYEPTIVDNSVEVRETSIAAEPDVASAAGDLYHLRSRAVEQRPPPHALII
jgi:hypothetical protein